MGPRERRHRQREELRNKILDAARELFTERGYEAVTMREIAKRIEYSPTTIYLHFKDKDALIRALCSMDFLELAERFKQVRGEPDPLKRFLEIGRAFLTFAEEFPNHYRMMFMTPHPPVKVQDRSIEKGNVEEDAWAIMNEEIEYAQRAGVFREDLGPPEVLAQLFFSAVHGVSSLFVAKSNDPWIDWAPARKLVDKMIYMMLAGCVSADFAHLLDSLLQKEDGPS